MFALTIGGLLGYFVITAGNFPDFCYFFPKSCTTDTLEESGWELAFQGLHECQWSHSDPARA